MPLYHLTTADLYTIRSPLRQLKRSLIACADDPRYTDHERTVNAQRLRDVETALRALDLPIDERPLPTAPTGPAWCSDPEHVEMYGGHPHLTRDHSR